MNIASLILGLISWIIPITAMIRRRRSPLGLAIGCCSASLLLQLMEVKRRVDLCDWSALMDTMNAVIFAALVMLGVSLALHALAYLRSRQK